MSGAAKVFLLFASIFLSAAFPLSANKITGFNFPTWWHDTYDSAESVKSLEALAATGARWVVLVPTWHTESLQADKVYSGQFTASDESLERAIKKAHSLGLRVMLKPHVDVKTGQVRAQISPKDPSAWFMSYSMMIFHYAYLAKKSKADMFCVGTELNRMAGYTEAWKELIAKTRTVYPGPLTYAANWYGLGNVQFWNDLDIIGIDAYFPLYSGPSKEGMKKNWKRFYIPNLEKLANKTGKPILFTELGIASQKGAHRRPYAWWEFGELDLDIQTAYYEALVESFKDKSWFAGFLQWAWEPKPNAGGLKDKSMTVQGKPALEVLKRFFKD